MKSPVGSELLARCTIVGTPANGIPRNTLSTKPGPNILLKIWTQAVPHCVVDALAGSVAAVLRPPATVSAAAVASTLVLMDMTVPFLDPAVPCARRWCAGQRMSAALVRDRNGWSPDLHGVQARPRTVGAGSHLALVFGPECPQGWRRCTLSRPSPGLSQPRQ